MWADGNSKEFSISHIYLSNYSGDKVYMLPYTMEEEFEKSILMDPPSPLK